MKKRKNKNYVEYLIVISLLVCIFVSAIWIVTLWEPITYAIEFSPYSDFTPYFILGISVAMIYIIKKDK